jgi:uncharacterized protein
MIKLSLVFTNLLLILNAGAQIDSSQTKTLASTFQRINSSLQAYKPDTSAVPDDKTTRKIKELINLRGVFNINEAIEFKIQEDKQKKNITEAEANSLSTFFSSGNGKQWLDNAIVHIYRNHFSFNELKQLVKFYRTPAGAKMSETFPVVLLKSMVAAQHVKELAGKR